MYDERLIRDQALCNELQAKAQAMGDSTRRSGAAHASHTVPDCGRQDIHELVDTRIPALPTSSSGTQQLNLSVGSEHRSASSFTSSGRDQHVIGREMPNYGQGREPERQNLTTHLARMNLAVESSDTRGRSPSHRAIGSQGSSSKMPEGSDMLQSVTSGNSSGRTSHPRAQPRRRRQQQQQPTRQNTEEDAAASHMQHVLRLAQRKPLHYLAMDHTRLPKRREQPAPQHSAQSLMDFEEDTTTNVTSGDEPRLTLMD